MRPIRLPSVAGAIVAIACAAREADWHKRFTGDSVFRASYYLDAENPLIPRLIAGSIALLVICMAGVVAVHVLRQVRQRPRPIPTWMWIGAIGLATFAVTKVFDRAPAILRKQFDLPLSERAHSMSRAFEEGVECMLPLVFAAGVIACVIARRRAPESSPPVATR